MMLKYRYWNNQKKEFEILTLAEIRPGCILISDEKGEPYFAYEEEIYSPYLKIFKDKPTGNDE